MAKHIGLIAAVLFWAPSAMAQEPPAPAMSTSWKAIALDQATCIARAQNAMTTAGLTKNYETVGESVFGEVTSYTGQIRCLTSKGIVWFIVAGPTLKAAGAYQRDMVQRFDKATP